MKVQALQSTTEVKKDRDLFTIVVDETNIHTNNRQEFAAFAGLAMPSNKGILMSSGIVAIKRDLGIPAHVPIKYNMRNGEKLSFNRFDLYGAIINLLISLEAKFFVNVVHTGILRLGEAQSLRMNLASTIATAEDLLTAHNGIGDLIVDQATYFQKKHQSQILTRGIQFQRCTKPIRRILSISESHVETHSMLQGLDVYLGCLQNWINKSKPAFVENCLLEKMSEMVWRNPSTGDYLGHGIKLLPTRIRVPSYQSEYLNLEVRLRDILNGPIKSIPWAS